MQGARLSYHEVAGFDGNLDLIRMLPKLHRAFIVLEEVDVRCLIRILLRSFELIVEIDPLAVASRDDLKTAVVPEGIV